MESFKRNSKKELRNPRKTSYATVTASEGVNYREIADTMTAIGFKMNHSSARNYVLKVMRKFADAIIREWDIDVPQDRIDAIVKSSQFQQAICDVLQDVEHRTVNDREKRSYR